MSKSEESSADPKVYPKPCPICGIHTNSINRLTHLDETTDWYSCNCGVIFQGTDPDYTIYNKEYIEALKEDKKYDDRAGYYSYCYAPIIEEETIGRKMLDVGCGISANIDHFAERGWLTWGIDINPDLEVSKRVTIADFMEFDPAAKLNTPEIQKLSGKDDLEFKYDLIWMNGVLSCFKDPLKALKKAWDMLDESGVLFIAVPDIDFITRVGLSGWSHWRSHEYKVLWSQRALERELKRIGFNIVVSRRNYAPRFTRWNDIHIVATKPYF